MLLVGPACTRQETESRPATPTTPTSKPALTTPGVPTDPPSCPAPDLQATYVPPPVDPKEPQPGLGGGAVPAGGQQFPSAVHYGDSPGPDGKPAPFINIIRTSENGGPEISADHASEFGTPVPVLDGEGHLLTVEDGYGSFFLHGEGPCNGYQVTAYGVSEEELRLFLQGLEEAPKASP